MKTFRIEPVTSEDSTITVEYDGNHIYISSDIMPIVCSDAQADKLGQILIDTRHIEDYMDQ